MPKINIEVSLITNDKEEKCKYKAILKKDQKEFLYNEQDNKKTKVKYNCLKKELIRENKELLMIFNFDETKNTFCKIFIKDLKKDIYLSIKTTSIYEDNNRIEINYLLENEAYKYKIEVIK